MKQSIILLLLLGVINAQVQVSLQSGAAVQNFPLVDYTDEKAG